VILTPDQLRSARRAANLTQQQAARRLRISQPYLALLETGHRPVTAPLTGRLAKLYNLGPLALPLTTAQLSDWNSATLATALANLGYTAFPKPARTTAHNPAVILLAAIAADDLEVRVLEALPWLAIQFHNLDWEWLMRESKLRDLQNRLGFIVTLARQLARKQDDGPAAHQLHQVEKALDRARLVREDTFCQSSLTDVERRWLRQNRPAEAAHWNLLTDLNAAALPYAA
jgi:transcriptional regulator with XRE-family HTH domain